MSPIAELKKRMGPILAVATLLMGLGAVGALAQAWSLHRRVVAAVTVADQPPVATPTPTPTPTLKTSAKDAATSATAKTATTTRTARTTTMTTTTMTASAAAMAATKAVKTVDATGKPVVVNGKPVAAGDRTTSGTSGISPTAMKNSGKGGSGNGKRATSDKKGRGDGNDGDASVELPEAMAKALKEHPIFGEPPRRSDPQLASILDDSALIDGNWIKQGEEQNGVKVIAIAPFKVTIEFEGARRDLTLWNDLPIGGEGGGPSGPPGMPSSSGATTSTSKSSPQRAPGSRPRPSVTMSPDGRSAMVEGRRVILDSSAMANNAVVISPSPGQP